MQTHKKSDGDIGDYLQLTQSLTESEKQLMESTQALRDLSLEQISLVLATLFED